MEVRCQMISGPRRPEGYWIKGEDGRIRCSRCEQVPINKILLQNRVVYEIPQIVELMHYCPRCGAKMD